MPKICVVGSCNIDLTFRVAHLPRPGETIAASALHQGFGGKGANQAVAAGKLGASVTMIGRVGDDPFGRQTLDNFRSHGIDTTFVGVCSNAPTGMASIYVSDAGENCIAVAPGANARLTPDDLRRGADAIRSANVVICQLETPVECALEAFRIARVAGVRTILNPAPALPLPDELLALTDIVVPNETELEILTGQSALGPDRLESAAGSLRDRGVGTVIVTLGAAGAFLLADPSTRVPAIPVHAVDPTGAGDVFTAALAVFLAEGAGLHEAVTSANEAAGLSVTRLGTQAAAPARGELASRRNL